MQSIEIIIPVFITSTPIERNIPRLKYHSDAKEEVSFLPLKKLNNYCIKLLNSNRLDFRVDYL
jgi:hypothetical protein